MCDVELRLRIYKKEFHFRMEKMSVKFAVCEIFNFLQILIHSNKFGHGMNERNIRSI